ncbi:MAG: hypothetical protein FRX48_05175 [Lasallia pustulata]|uniref:Uncharacterized protein n=1 Tax=Lasallia pustulata TaxID=136370 RepID=A0A5M8PN29_9LECA|nr:MAG: hypothetical protein FRX48_05175 [Lasallia pustulata]
MGAPYASQIDDGAFGSFHLKRTKYEYPDDAIKDYQYYVMEYADRDMSNKSDVLLAFKGIESILRQSMDSDFCYGLPAYKFDWALLWTLTGPHKKREVIVKGSRRIFFPSWTWAGWDSQIEYGAYFNVKRIRREINWYLIDGDGAATFLDTDNDAVELESTESDNGIVGPVGQSPIHLFNKEQLRSRIHANNHSWADSKSLACWTTVAVFGLTGEEESRLLQGD